MNLMPKPKWRQRQRIEDLEVTYYIRLFSCSLYNRLIFNGALDTFLSFTLFYTHKLIYCYTWTIFVQSPHDLQQNSLNFNPFSDSAPFVFKPVLTTPVMTMTVTYFLLMQFAQTTFTTMQIKNSSQCIFFYTLLKLFWLAVPEHVIR